MNGESIALLIFIPKNYMCLAIGGEKDKKIKEKSGLLKDLTCLNNRINTPELVIKRAFYDL